ncbi:MAG: hypothetical protein GX979_02295 [Firmicutes bacterium]|nr:hypothetical protein [Bacillota bacterium]
MRYFLGIRLPKELEETCERYRRAFKAPKTVAHLTVVPPFEWEQPAGELFKLLAEALEETKPFAVTGAGVGSFGNRVLFINVNLTPELEAMQKALTLCLKTAGVSVDNRPYHPHVTLATRLTAEEFSRYSRELADFHPEIDFVCSSLSIFEFTKERRWKEAHRLSF